MDNNEILKVLKKIDSELDDTERNIKSDNSQRALYDLSYAQDRVRKLIRALR